MESHEFEIFARHSRSTMLRTARYYLFDSDEAENVVQDALIKLYSIRDRLDASRGIEPLANIVVRNMAVDRLRQRARHPVSSLQIDIRDSEPTDTEEELSEILRAIEQLPTKQQLILRMKHIEGLEAEEIATTLQMNIDAVYQNISRARRAILNKFKRSER